MLNITEIPPFIRQDFFVDKEYAPQVIVVRDFNENGVRDFQKDFQQAVQRRQSIIPIQIDSYGGQVYSLLAMLNIIRNSPVPVATFTQSKAMSCGAFLLGFGTKGYRYVAPGAKVMLHEVSSVAFGKVHELASDSQEAKDLNDDLFRQLSVHCGWNENYFHRLIHERNHADIYLTSKEVHKRKLADFVGTPQLVTKLSLEIKLELLEPKGF